MKNTTANNPKKQCRASKRSGAREQRLSRRAAGTKTTQTKTRWRVEERFAGTKGEWIGTGIESKTSHAHAERQRARAAKHLCDREWRVVEVVERRTIVAQLRASSPSGGFSKRWRKLTMKNKTRTEAAQQPNAKAFAASRGSALRADAENYDDACSLLERHKRTLRLLVAGDFITEEKLEQAWEIAGIGSESREFMAAGIALIQAKLGAALVTLKQEAGGCPATKLLINDALSTASKLLGSQNDADQQQAGGRVS